jgi:Zn finger protein HypA/HybF involved in hydrogenase expression
MRKAAFSCCVCRKSNVSVEVHHIIPQSKGGDYSIENAAPLCPNCHSDYGNNPDKRKRIKRMRDCWYDTIEKMYSGNNVSPEELGKIHNLLQNVSTKQDSIIKRQSKHDNDLETLKVRLREFSNKTIDKMTVESSDVVITGVISTAVDSTQSIRVSEGPWDVKCNNCRRSVNISANYCPYCGNSMK